MNRYERNELAAIYVKRGLDSTLANQVAEQLMAKDALGAHARDELGISETITARPVQAAAYFRRHVYRGCRATFTGGCRRACRQPDTACCGNFAFLSRASRGAGG